MLTVAADRVLSRTALSRMAVKFANFRGLLFPLRRHLRRIGLTWNAAGSELRSGEIILGRTVVFADFRGHDSLRRRFSIQ